MRFLEMFWLPLLVFCFMDSFFGIILIGVIFGGDSETVEVRKQFSYRTKFI